jgi:hypothetical protein
MQRAAANVVRKGGPVKAKERRMSILEFTVFLLVAGVLGFLSQRVSGIRLGGSS